MKIRIPHLAAAIFWLLSIPLFPQMIDVYACAVQVERSHDFDVWHYLIRLEIDITGKTFGGETTVTMQPLLGNLKKVVLDAEDFTVTSVRSAWGGASAFLAGTRPLDGRDVPPNGARAYAVLCRGLARKQSPERAPLLRGIRGQASSGRFQLMALRRAPVVSLL